MLPLIPLALSVAPQLAKWLFGDDAEKTATTVVNTVQQVTGAVDDITANAAIAKDPTVLANLQQALAKIAADKEATAEQARMDELKAYFADVAGARSQTVELAKAGSAIAWGAPVVSVVILLIFLATLYMAMTHEFPTGSKEILVGVVGALTGMATMVANYWLGSSKGSADKAEHIAALSTTLAKQLQLTYQPTGKQ